VARLALCYPDIGALPPKPDASGAFVAMCFGMINANKQPERILRALAADPDLKKRGRARFVGPIDDAYRARLAALAQELGLAAPEFYGWVDDARLCALIAQAHLLCCLRHPVTEGGSASVITALYSSRPIVVNDVGSYAEIPDGLTLKIAASETPEPLTAAMVQIARDPRAAEAAAARAADYARSHYSARAYVDGLEPLLSAAAAGLPALRAARRMGRRLGALGVGFDDGAAARLEGRLVRG
jgi:glycosyltransferase involved in cell wall biosynthesis